MEESKWFGRLGQVTRVIIDGGVAPRETITIEVTEDLPHAVGASDGDIARAAQLALAILWYDRGQISQGKGAELRAEMEQALSGLSVDTTGGESR